MQRRHIFDIQKFEQVKIAAEQLYNTIGEVYCPYFKEKVHFNSLGLEHLKFKRRGKTRLIQDQYMRFKLLHLVPDILKNSGTVQGIWETKGFERTRIHSRTENILKLVTYFEFIAVVGKYRLRVILKQVGEENTYFWSIIPYWRFNRKTRTRKMHEGNPEED